jgi:uncharacterized protein (TIGR02246 family)
MTAAIDDRQIRTLFDRLLQAWTDGDAHAYGARFTADVDYVSYDGTRAAGRAPVIANHRTGTPSRRAASQRLSG